MIGSAAAQERPDGTEVAPEGHVYQCGGCFRRARSRYGFNLAGVTTVIDAGYDSSCSSWAVLTRADVAEAVRERLKAAGIPGGEPCRP